MLAFLSSITLGAWSALIATFAAIWAVLGNTLEWRRTRFLKGIELLDSYSQDFADESFREKRRASANYLLSANRDVGKAPEALYDILDFFECIGYLKRKKLFEDEAIWHFFASWLLPYVIAADDEIKHTSKTDPTLYENIWKLYTDVERVERKRHPSQQTLHIISPSNVRRFLEDEQA